VRVVAQSVRGTLKLHAAQAPFEPTLGRTTALLRIARAQPRGDLRRERPRQTRQFPHQLRHGIRSQAAGQVGHVDSAGAAIAQQICMCDPGVVVAVDEHGHRDRDHHQ
jgi:hypothetical protein